MVWCWCVMSSFLILFNLLTQFHDAALTSTYVTHVAENLQRQIQSVFKASTRFHKLQDAYDTLWTEKQIAVRPLNVSQVGEEFNENVRELLLSKIESVKNIKTTAEELYKNYTFDSKIEQFSYLNDKSVPEDSVRDEPTFFLGVKVNLNRTHVQLPTNIYEYDKTILNDVKWTKGLDKAFLENYQRYPTLLWQYFGRDTGLVRNYPGFRQDANVLDLYDCRRRHWYGQAINSPKDVLILLDQSGSMTGNHFTIAKLAVKSLINTLQQDDFFNVVTFREKTEYLIPCLEKLTQATSRHKSVLKDAVDKLRGPSGTSDPKLALQTALNMLKSNNKGHTSSSNCTKVLLLISDGIESSSIHDDIEKLNKDGEVIIFSYIVGLNRMHVKEMKKIACKNGGESYDLLTVGNVWNRAVAYQTVLSKPIATANEDMVSFTPLYLDSSGLGMMTTISIGVFDKNKNNAKLLGVAAVDIRIESIKQQYPKSKLGVFGHAFSVNNNGLFLIHPRFRDQSGDDPATVYLDEVEYTIDRNKSLMLKAEMIDRKTGCMNAELDWLFTEQARRVVRYNTTYCYFPSKDTPFSTGVAIPYANQKYIHAQPLTNHLSESISALRSQGTENVQVANWMFCDFVAKAQKNQPKSLKSLPTANELYTYLQTFYNNDMQEKIKDNCVANAIWSLLQSARITKNFKTENWKEVPSNESIYKALFVISSSGYVISQTFDNSSLNISRDILTEPRYTHPSSYQVRGVPEIIVFSTTMKNGRQKSDSFQNNNSTISVGRPITVSQDEALAAVIGMEVVAEKFQELFVSSSEVLDSSCKNCGNISCKDKEKLRCYLLDENAYVVTSNQELSKQGLFFGYVNGVLMQELEKLEIYNKNEFIDSQAQCQERVLTKTSNAASLSTFWRNIQSFFLYFLNQVVILVTILSAICIKTSDAVIGADFRIISCSLKINIHTAQNQSLQHFGDILCGRNCKQTYGIQSLEGTNLVLVMTEDECSGALCSAFTYGNTPLEMKQIPICSETQQYRKALPLCYKRMDDTNQCQSGSGNQTSRSHFLIIFANFLFFIYGTLF